MADQNPSQNGAGGAQGPNQPVNWNRQIVVWALIVIVVLIFGMGGNWTVMMQGKRKVMGDVDDHDAMTRMDVSQRIQSAISPYNMPENMQMVAQKLVFARLADDEGLMPKGAALDKLVQDFLNKPLPSNPTRRIVDGLEDRKGSPNEVTLDELRRYIAEQYAVKAFVKRNISAPAVPAAVADAAFATASAQQDSSLPSEKIKVDQVTISAKRILPEIADDDPEIQSTYEKLRGARFGIPATAVLTVIEPDRDALMKAAPITDEDIQKYYDANKRDFIIPIDIDEAVGKENQAPAFKDLATVKDEIRTVLAREYAGKTGKEQMFAFEQAIRERELENDDAALKQAAKDAGLSVAEGVEVKQDKDGKLVIGHIGELKQQERDVGLFAQKIGFISGLTQTVGETPVWLLFHLTERREPSSKDLSDPDVKKEVKEHLAGERAYKQLLAEAEAIRAAAEKSGKGGLRSYFADDEVKKKWKTRVNSKTLTPLTMLKPPADEQGIVSGEGRLAISLALPSSPAILAASDKQDENVPSVKIVQAAEVQPGDPLKDEAVTRLAQDYRRAIESHRWRVFNDEMLQKLNQ